MDGCIKSCAEGRVLRNVDKRGTGPDNNDQGEAEPESHGGYMLGWVQQ